MPGYNRRKRVMRITLRESKNDFRILLETSEAEMVYVETRDLTAAQARVVSDGYVNGLQWAGTLPREFIDALLSDPLEMASLHIPLTIDPADRGLFKRGMVGALELAAKGYWSTPTESHSAMKRPVTEATVPSPVC